MNITECFGKHKKSRKSYKIVALGRKGKG